MKPSGALIWKEWRESHVYLWIGLGVFLILPLINALQEIYYRQRFLFEASGWITLLGGTFAVLLGVGLSCRDLHSHLEDFWRSRPIPLGRWLAIKYTVGLLILLLCCVSPAVLEFVFNKNIDAENLILWFPSLWIAIFSLSFFIGTLLRRTAQTSLIAVSAMLLLYLVPVILPPLHSLSIAAISAQPYTEQSYPPQVIFAVSMCLLSVLFIALAFAAVKRQWRLAVGREMLFGSVVLAVVLLLLTTAFQLGTNMPVLQSLPLPKDVYATNLFSIQGQVLFNAGRRSVNPNDPTGFAYRRVSIGAGGQLSVSSPKWRSALVGAAFPADSSVSYEVEDNNSDDEVKKGIFLRITNLADGTRRTLPLRPIIKNAEGLTISWQLDGRVFGNRLYLPGDQLIILDIAKPLSPRIISKTPYGFPKGTAYGTGAATLDSVIPPAPGLSDFDQFLLAGPPGIFDGREYLLQEYEVAPHEQALELYKLQSLSNGRARFIRIAERKPPLLESIFLGGGYDHLVFKGDKIYALQKNRSQINAIITVFSVTGPHPLQMLGHFGAPRIDGMVPLEDGRCLVATGTDSYRWSTQLLLLGPPPTHD